MPYQPVRISQRARWVWGGVAVEYSVEVVPVATGRLQQTGQFVAIPVTVRAALSAQTLTVMAEGAAARLGAGVLELPVAGPLGREASITFQLLAVLPGVGREVADAVTEIVDGDAMQGAIPQADTKRLGLCRYGTCGAPSSCGSVLKATLGM